ncbi:site-specific integrase [Cytobacillus oceanisediminis]|uniref:site-specific integrase n=1 Tax=Cytobacillus oceanisediminis TaxID=665099 RepID=UPI0018652B75|nr:site-specific integrase [Cytobacillus oceanisediminis]QOK28027.1 site-specific integrase [Cytobacillus oceanisediminis]
MLCLASFRQRSKKWEYRIKYVDPQTGKPKEKTKGGFRTKKEAQIEAAEVEKQLYLGQHSIIQNKELLVKEWFEKWLDIYGSQCKPKTLITRTNFINTHIIPQLGNYKLNQLSRIDYQKFINKLLEKYAKTTVQTIHSIFSSAINKAVEMELLPNNRYKNISIKKEDTEDTKINYLNKDELDIFMDTAKKTHFHHYIIASMLLRTGMRKGEMLALKWDDIDFKNSTISITKSRSENGVSKPKTKSSIRTIGIDNTLLAELKTYKTWQKKNKMKYGPNYRESEYLITSPNGREMGEFGVNKVIDSIVEKANLHHITPHGLRHTHAIMLLESGADIKFVSDRLGHSSINMTADVYLHVTKKHEEVSVQRFESYLNN